MVGNDSLSNFHSEPALARRMVTFNETGQNQVLTAHSSGELNKQQIDKPRKKGGKSKVLKKPKCSPSHSHSGGGGESQQGLQQNGVLRISAPFLNNPAAQSVYLYRKKKHRVMMIRKCLELCNNNFLNEPIFTTRTVP